MILYYLLPSKINMFLSNLNFTLAFDSSHMMMTMEFNAFGHHLENNWKIHNIFSLLCQMGHHFSSLGFNGVERQMDPGGQRLITHRAPRLALADRLLGRRTIIIGSSRDWFHPWFLPLVRQSVSQRKSTLASWPPKSTRPFDTPPLYSGCRR